MSLTSVLLPEPLTPVTHVSVPSGNSTSMLSRLFAAAPSTFSAVPLPARRSPCAIGASAILVPRVFELDYSVRLAPVGTIWLVVVALTVLTGLVGSRDLLRRPPLPVLRDAPE